MESPNRTIVIFIALLDFNFSVFFWVFLFYVCCQTTGMIGYGNTYPLPPSCTPFSPFELIRHLIHFLCFELVDLIYCTKSYCLLLLTCPMIVCLFFTQRLVQDLFYEVPWRMQVAIMCKHGLYYIFVSVCVHGTVCSVNYHLVNGRTPRLYCQRQDCPRELLHPPEDCNVNSSLSFTLQVLYFQDRTIQIVFLVTSF